MRTHWDDEQEKWCFSVIDVVAVLTDSPDPGDYWFKMKIRVKTEDGLELSTICRQLKMKVGKIAKDARLALEQKTGNKVIISNNFLLSATEKKKLNKKK